MITYLRVSFELNASIIPGDVESQKVFIQELRSSRRATTCVQVVGQFFWICMFECWFRMSLLIVGVVGNNCQTFLVMCNCKVLVVGCSMLIIDC